jgi:(R,R)-butanediol dehydrogenase/meso-butanediol dehydrogenase/diacetyl reductase
LLACRWHAARDLRLEDVPEPGPATNEVLVEVGCAAICGSDIAEYRDGPHVIPVGRPHPLTGRAAPVTLGHEYAGRVVATGSEVNRVAVGDRVCGDSCLRCNSCRWCLRGEYNICRVGGSVGLHLDGAFARYLVVPDYTLVKLADSVGDVAGALVEPLAVGLHAVTQGRVEAGDTVIVVGAGMIGLAACLMSHVAGAAEVLVVEPRLERAQLAQSLGATRVLPADVAVARREVRADVVVECSGRPDVVGGALELVRRGGRLVLAGIGHGAAELDPSRVVYFEREIIGALGYRFDLDRVVALLAGGRIDVTPLLADPIALTDIVAGGFERSLNDRSAPPRVFVGF